MPYLLPPAKKLREDRAPYKVPPPHDARAGVRTRARYLPRIADTMARGSRLGQRPVSTACRKSATCWLNAPGSSRLMVWPVFGITTRPAGRDRALHQQRGFQAWPILVARHDQRRRGNGLHAIDQVEQRRPALLHATHGQRRTAGRISSELVGEFLPAARVLVLELHARRRERVAHRRLAHADLLEAPGGGLGFLRELRTLVGGCAIAAAADDQRQCALRIGEAEVQRRKSAHRQTDDVGLVDLQSVQARI